MKHVEDVLCEHIGEVINAFEENKNNLLLLGVGEVIIDSLTKGPGVHHTKGNSMWDQTYGVGQDELYVTVETPTKIETLVFKKLCDNNLKLIDYETHVG